MKNDNKIKVAFVVGNFPRVSETFIINQIADLKDRGIEVEVFSFRKDFKGNDIISDRFQEYNMKDIINYLEMPKNYLLRILLAIPKIILILFTKPIILIDLFNFKKYGRNASSLKLIFWVTPFINKKFDLVHCHFGPVANRYLIVKEILNLKQKIVTTLYGYDVSRSFREKPSSYYDKLIKQSSNFLVMSNNMKERVVEYGFPEDRVEVLPVSIDVESYPFNKRSLENDEQINLISVGNFVEKKGFDDLLKALAIVKVKTNKKFKCYIIGDGPLKDEIYDLYSKLNLKNLVEFKGYMKLENVMKYFKDMHLFIQPSKTAKDGDME
ncbi:glycosyltransferase [bacterium]|nr:glycosyltransferase [bacterium]